MIKAQQGFRPFACGDDNLFVGTVVQSPAAKTHNAGFTFGVYNDLAHAVTLRRAFQPVGIRQQTNLHKKCLPTTL